MILTTEDYLKLTDAVTASAYFVGMIRAIHDQGHFLDPHSGMILGKGSPQLVAKFEEALSVMEQRCEDGLRVVGKGGVN